MMKVRAKPEEYVHVHFEYLNLHLYIFPLCFPAGPQGPSHKLTEYSYQMIGTGYCKDWVYLPEGGYPGFLPESDSLSVPEDRIEECLMRCLSLVGQNGKAGANNKKLIANQAFYVNNKKQCACSSGSCPLTADKNLVSYKINAKEVVKKGEYGETRDDGTCNYRNTLLSSSFPSTY